MSWQDLFFYKAAFLYIEDIGSDIYLPRIVEYFGETRLGDIEHMEHGGGWPGLASARRSRNRSRHVETVVTAIIRYASGDRRVSSETAGNNSLL